MHTNASQMWQFPHHDVLSHAARLGKFKISTFTENLDCDWILFHSLFSSRFAFASLLEASWIDKACYFSTTDSKAPSAAHPPPWISSITSDGLLCGWSSGSNFFPCSCWWNIALRSWWAQSLWPLMSGLLWFLLEMLSPLSLAGLAPADSFSPRKQFLTWVPCESSLTTNHKTQYFLKCI